MPRHSTAFDGQCQVRDAGRLARFQISHCCCCCRSGISGLHWRSTTAGPPSPPPSCLFAISENASDDYNTLATILWLNAISSMTDGFGVDDDLGPMMVLRCAMISFFFVRDLAFGCDSWRCSCGWGFVGVCGALGLGLRSCVRRGWGYHLG